MRTTLALTFLLTAGIVVPRSTRADDKADAAKLVADARDEYKVKNWEKAAELAAKAAALDPKSPDAHMVLGLARLQLRRNEQAAEALTKAIELNPKAAALYDRRGDAYLKTGKFAEAVADFDKFLELIPKESKSAEHHWRRGIALYYAGKFEDGKKQFELHRTVNPEDVENSAWHYLCNARATSPKQARAELIPVTKDARVPMKQVLELFAGKLKPADVIDAAEKSGLKGDELTSARFYAHLYVGLYYESEGDAKKALEHIAAAVEKYKVPDYMWDVAAAHLAVLKKKKD